MRFGPSCYQLPWSSPASPWTHEYLDHTPVSEDCLSLNVWAPRRDKTPRAVVVWIHGGGFVGGGSSVPIYDGRAMAAKGVVFVSLNYRVGVFGFYTSPSLVREAAGGAPANWGLQDVIAALKWVQGNIAAFGGDPSQVTIAGQSAGSIIVHDLLASPSAKGLFARAIAESGLPSDGAPKPLAVAEAAGLAFQRAAGVDSLEALRAMPADKLAAVPTPDRPLPIVDGVVLPLSPAVAARTGRTQDVPLMLGFNANEHAVLGPEPPSPSEQAYLALFRDRYGPSAAALAADYPASTPTERELGEHDLAREEGAAAIVTLAASAEHQAPVYAYCFSHVEPGRDAQRWRAFHSSEIPYAYGNLDKAPERAFSPLDKRLSRDMVRYWTDFIKTGDPNGAGLPVWPALTSSDPRFLVIGDTIHADPMMPAARLDDFRKAYSAGVALKVLH